MIKQLKNITANLTLVNALILAFSVRLLILPDPVSASVVIGLLTVYGHSRYMAAQNAASVVGDSETINARLDAHSNAIEALAEKRSAEDVHALANTQSMPNGQFNGLTPDEFSNMINGGR